MRKLLTKQNAILYGGYAAFFCVCFVLFAYLTFPYERVKSVLEQRLSQSSGVASSKLSIGELGPHFLTGVALRDVVYERKSAPDAEPAKAAIDALQLRASLWSLLTSGLSVNFGGEVGAGEIDGNFSQGEGSPTRVDAELDGVDLGKLGAGAFIGIPVQGLATGDVDVTLTPEPANSQGDVTLTIDQLRLADGKTPVKVPGMGDLTLQTIDAGKLELKLAIRDGVATIERMESKGKDLELSGSGSIRLAIPFAQSRADILLSVKVLDAYGERNEMMKSMMHLLKQNALIQSATASDGSMSFRISGPVAALRALPGSRSGGPARPAKPRKKVPGPD